MTLMLLVISVRPDFCQLTQNVLEVGLMDLPIEVLWELVLSKFRCGCINLTQH